MGDIDIREKRLSSRLVFYGSGAFMLGVAVFLLVRFDAVRLFAAVPFLSRESTALFLVALGVANIVYSELAVRGNRYEQDGSVLQRTNTITGRSAAIDLGDVVRVEVTGGVLYRWTETGNIYLHTTSSQFDQFRMYGVAQPYRVLDELGLEHE